MTRQGLEKKKKKDKNLDQSDNSNYKIKGRVPFMRETTEKKSKSEG